MLIDDDEPTNFFHETIIKKTDCAKEVIVFQKAEQALNYLKESNDNSDDSFKKPDLLLVDINMPRMNGWEFLHAFEKLPEENRKDIVVLLLSTSTLSEDEIKALGTTAEFYSKPLTINVLKQIIEKHFSSNVAEIPAA